MTDTRGKRRRSHAGERFNPVRRDEIVARVIANTLQRPSLLLALNEDAAVFAANRFEPFEFASPLKRWMNIVRLAWVSDDYLGLALFRIRSSLQASRVPLLPRIIHHICILFFGIRIGSRVVLKERIYLPHGNVVIDGVVLVGKDCVICPWTTIGVQPGDPSGPELGNNVFVGTGAKILGEVKVGDGAVIGAGAVVVDDVPPFCTVVGVPARVVGQDRANWIRE